MTKNTVETFLAIQRIESLISLGKVFDLIHEYYFNKNIPSNFESIDEVYEAQTNLYVILLSYIYSLFDRRGTNILNLDSTSLNESTKISLDRIQELWAPLKKVISRIRHNVGFHGGELPQLMDVSRVADEINNNNLLPKIVLLLGELGRFSHALKQEISHKTPEH